MRKTAKDWTPEEAWALVGNQSTEHLKMMQKALNMLPMMNTPEQEERLDAVNYILKNKVKNPRYSSKTAGLSEKMDFDHPVEVHADGSVTDASGVYAPSVYDWEGNTGLPEIDGSGWSFFTTGYSGQYGYSGPVMHASEYVGGGLEQDILSNPGIYVTVSVEDMDDPEGPYGWAVLRKGASKISMNEQSGHGESELDTPEIPNEHDDETMFPWEVKESARKAGAYKVVSDDPGVQDLLYLVGDVFPTEEDAQIASILLAEKGYGTKVVEASWIDIRKAASFFEGGALARIVGQAFPQATVSWGGLGGNVEGLAIELGGTTYYVSDVSGSVGIGSEDGEFFQDFLGLEFTDSDTRDIAAAVIDVLSGLTGTSARREVTAVWNQAVTLDPDKADKVEDENENEVDPDARVEVDVHTAAVIPQVAVDLLTQYITPFDTPENRGAYQTGNYPRSENTKDVDERYRWDLFWAANNAYRQGEGAGMGMQDKLEELAGRDFFDSHLDTALRKIVPRLSSRQAYNDVDIEMMELAEAGDRLNRPKGGRPYDDATDRKLLRDLALNAVNSYGSATADLVEMMEENGIAINMENDGNAIFDALQWANQEWDSGRHYKRKQAKKVEELQSGDVVDLQGDPYADEDDPMFPEGKYSYEYAVVDEVWNQEMGPSGMMGSDEILVNFIHQGGELLISFPTGHEIKTATRKHAEQAQKWGFEAVTGDDWGQGEVASSEYIYNSPQEALRAGRDALRQAGAVEGESGIYVYADTEDDFGSSELGYSWSGWVPDTLYGINSGIPDIRASRKHADAANNPPDPDDVEVGDEDDVPMWPLDEGQEGLLENVQTDASRKQGWGIKYSPVVYSPDGDKAFVDENGKLTDDPNEAVETTLDMAEQMAWSAGFRRWGDDTIGPIGGVGGNGTWNYYGEMARTSSKTAQFEPGDNVQFFGDDGEQDGWFGGYSVVSQEGSSVSLVQDGAPLDDSEIFKVPADQVRFVGSKTAETLSERFPSLSDAEKEALGNGAYGLPRTHDRSDQTLEAYYMIGLQIGTTGYQQLEQWTIGSKMHSTDWEDPLVSFSKVEVADEDLFL